MTLTTYSDFQDLESSEKLGLVTVEPAKRLKGWVLDSGSVYKITSFNFPVITTIEDSGTAYTEVFDLGSVVASTFFNDRTNQILYTRATDSSNPNGRFLVMTFKLFFSNNGVNAANDLSTGFDVEWLPLLAGISDFGVELDNTNQIGFAVEGAGKITFRNDKDFWDSRFDKLYFENKRCLVYSWHRDLPITEAKLIYRGRIQRKQWSTKTVSFILRDTINELRSQVSLANMEDVAGAIIPANLNDSKQRLVYGFVNGNRPTNIQQVLSTGFILSGTVSTVAGSPTLTGVGTDFLAKLSPDDELKLSGLATNVVVGSIASDTSLTLSEDATRTLSGVTFTVLPALPKRYTNRIWLIAGHALKEPSTTITSSTSTNTFVVADSTDFLNGDSILVGSVIATIRRVAAGDQIRLEENLALVPANGTVVKKLTVSNVFINDNRLLTFSSDYDYEATTAKLTLDDLAEFNVAPVRNLIGTVTFTSASRSVTGSGTSFLSQLNSNSWIRADSESDFFEVLSIESDTALTLRILSTYSKAEAAKYKRSDVFNNASDVLSLDTLGKTEDGTATGTFIKTGPQIVEDQLKVIGLTSILDTTSFDLAETLAPQRVGMVIPDNFRDKGGLTVRDVINRVNKTLFGSLTQNNDFDLKYEILSPGRLFTTTLRLNDDDVLSFNVMTDGSKIAKTTIITFNRKEFDRDTQTEGSNQQQVTSDIGQFLAESSRETTRGTILIDETDALILAGRYRFLFETASTIFNFRTKLQASRSEINDVVEVELTRLYERIGSTDKRKVAAVQKATRSFSKSNIGLEDLANAFSRCSTITPNDAASFDDSDSDELLYNGFITDNFGMQGNDPDTDGVSLIW